MPTTKVEATTHIRCDYCPPDDNEWTADAFTGTGTAFAGRKRMCYACFAERYPARYTNCSACGCRMKTRGRGDPTCRRCRRGETPARCGECGTGAADTRMHETPNGLRCSRCYQAERKAA